MKKRTFFDLTDFRIGFCKEIIEDNGEDSFFSELTKKYCVLAVFDGCGGLGAKRYLNFSNKTGAYVAARALSGATKKMFNDVCVTKVNAEVYKKYADKALSVLDMYADKSMVTIKGSLRRKFPSTIAAAALFVNNDKMNITFMWAGDSRGYILNESGLHQITNDDIENEDAMSNLHNDGILTNVPSFGGKYTIHEKKLVLKFPAAIICTTDGCFGYFSTPMDFENVLLSTLMRSRTPKEWEDSLKEEIGEVASDDYTLILHSVMYGSFENLKKKMKKRYACLREKYIENLQSSTLEDKYRLWNVYKNNYYEYGE